jgi:DNA-binding CsgD family transcriptional regulator
LEAVFNRAKRACYAGLDSVTLRHEVAERISSAVPFDAHAFSTCDPDTGLMTHTVADSVPVALAHSYIEMIYPQALAQIATDMARKGVSVFASEDQIPLAREVLAEHGVGEQLHVSISCGGRLWGLWCLMRASASSATSTRHYPFLERLAPHLARGLQAAALIDCGLADGNSPSTECVPGVLVLDSKNRPTLRTWMATTWLNDLRDVGLQMPDDIPLSIISLASRLRARRIAVAEEEHLRVRGLSGRWYTLRASLAEPDSSGESSAVIVIRPAMALEVATILTQLYGFSLREREVVAAIARGEASKSIAAALGVSPHTVTEHIERACDKLGVHGRKALIAKLFFDGYAPRLGAARPTIGNPAAESVSLEQ